MFFFRIYIATLWTQRKQIQRYFGLKTFIIPNSEQVGIFAKYFGNFCKMFRKFLQNVSKVFAKCFGSFCKMFRKFLQNVSEVFAKCFGSFCKMFRKFQRKFTKGVYTVFRCHAHCTFLFNFRNFWTRTFLMKNLLQMILNPHTSSFLYLCTVIIYINTG